MGASGKAKRTRGEWTRLAVYAVLVAACVAVFLIFGKKERSIPTNIDAEPTPVPSATPVPKGVPIGKFVQALAESGMNCEFSESEKDESGAFVHPIALPDGRDGARLVIKTDGMGRVVECTLELAYIYAGEPDDSYSEAIAAVIRDEYRHREQSDAELCGAFLGSIYAQLGDDLNISTIDGKKIADSISSAYLSRKVYDKKAGGARFYCETEAAESEQYRFIFRIIASFDYSK